MRIAVIVRSLLAGPYQQSQKPLILRVRKFVDLLAGDPLDFGFAPRAILLPLAVSHFDHQRVVRQGFRDVHHVQDLASRRPGVAARLLFALDLPAQSGEVPLPVRTPPPFLCGLLYLRPRVRLSVWIGAAARTYPSIPLILI